MHPDILVLGAGSWGTALASHLARCGHKVSLWGRDADFMQELRTTRINKRYLPDIVLPATLDFSLDLDLDIRSVSVVLVATPSHSFELILQRIKPLLPERCTLIWACKGFHDGRLLHEVVYSNLGDLHPAVVLSGPNFAAELARGLPTATTIASSTMASAQRASALFHHDTFRAYASDDLVGVQLAGALKNIYAIASGISDGLGFGANARAALITRGLAEMGRLSESLSANRETLMGLSGVGDLVLTCTDDQSRNRRFGLALGRGLGFEEAIASIGQVVEGAGAARQVKFLADKHGVDTPIAHQVYEVLYENKRPADAVKELLARALRNEIS